MRKTTKIIIGVIIVAILLLGVGYAAIQNVTLNIAGTVKADPSQSNFNVKFSGTPTVSDEAKVKAAVTDDINATINVEGLTTLGESVSATYTVQNTSTDLSADLSVATTNSNEEYFKIKAELAKTSLVAGEATTVTVTVTLTKAPISESVIGTIGVQLVATPVQPGQEGTTGGTGTSQSPEQTLALVTNANIGEYIDLGNDIVDYNGKTGVTTDDWRIFYVDENTNKVYVILSNYFPIDTKVPVGTVLADGITVSDGTKTYAENAGLITNSTNYPYAVWSNTDADTLLAGLTNSTAWMGLANGITGATVTATPTVDLLNNSYYEKNGTNFEMYGVPLDSSTTDFDLYVPQVSAGDYWLATRDIFDETYLITVDDDGNVDRRFWRV